MADRIWYVARNGQQEGPYPEAQLRQMVAGRMVDRATLVWTEGMAAWAAAGEIPGLIPVSQMPPSAPPASQWRAAPTVAAPDSRPTYGGAAAMSAPSGGGRLAAEFGLWGLIGRGLLWIIAVLVVIPAPWVAVSNSRWFVSALRVPQRPNLAFTGKVGDIWYVFVLIGLCNYLGLFAPKVAYVGSAVALALNWLALRWFVAHVSPDGQSTPLRFTGGFWAYVGWSLLVAIAALTIIGWAWALAAQMRWICRRIEGSTRGLSFVGTGWEVLWRSWVFALCATFIIPIPWILRWYAHWFVSQFQVGESAG